LLRQKDAASDVDADMLVLRKTYGAGAGAAHATPLFCSVHAPMRLLRTPRVLPAAVRRLALMSVCRFFIARYLMLPDITLFEDRCFEPIYPPR